MVGVQFVFRFIMVSFTSDLGFLFFRLLLVFHLRLIFEFCYGFIYEGFGILCSSYFRSYLRVIVDMCISSLCFPPPSSLQFDLYYFVCNGRAGGNGRGAVEQSCCVSRLISLPY